MTRTTKKLSGPGLDRFFQRFFRRQPGLDTTQADRLARISARTFASANVRTVAVQALQIRTNETCPTRPRPTHTQPTEGLPSSKTLAQPDKTTGISAPPHSKPSTANARSSAQNAPATGTDVQNKFDPYVFGLVPVFQRQGPVVLRQRLKEIGTPAHLRTMARAQQIILPAALRSGEASSDTLCDAIVKAVAKRIADRRAAAG